MSEKIKPFPEIARFPDEPRLSGSPHTVRDSVLLSTAGLGQAMETIHDLEGMNLDQRNAYFRGSVSSLSDKRHNQLVSALGELTGGGLTDSITLRNGASQLLERLQPESKRKSPSDQPRVPALPPELITLKDASQMFGLSEHQLARVIRSGKIAALRIGIRTFLTTAEAIQFYLENDPARKHDPWKKVRQKYSSGEAAELQELPTSITGVEAVNPLTQTDAIVEEVSEVSGEATNSATKLVEAKPLSGTNGKEKSHHVADWLENFFIPGLLPIDSAHADAPFLGWTSGRFNPTILDQYETLAQEELAQWERADKSRKLAEQVRTYWGTVVKNYGQSLREGITPEGLKVDFAINASTFAPDDQFHLFPLLKPGRHFLRVSRETEYQKDFLSIDNPDTGNHRFVLRSYIDSPARPVTTKYEIEMTLPWGRDNWGDTHITDFSVSKSQYCDITRAPGFWDKVKADLAAQNSEVTS